MRKREQVEIDRDIEDGYPSYLKFYKGLSHTQLKNPKGLKGSKFGPANQGRILTDDEKLKIELELKSKGLL